MYTEEIIQDLLMFIDYIDAEGWKTWTIGKIASEIRNIVNQGGLPDECLKWAGLM